MPMTMILLLTIGGMFVAYARPFEGALWFGIACMIGGIYWAWRYGKSIRKKREDWEKNNPDYR